MFNARGATMADENAIAELYKRVAAGSPGGIARSLDEITATYIRNFMQEAALHGLEMVVDNPDKPGEIIAEIHCHKLGPKAFDHILSELTILVDPAFHGRGVGKLIFSSLLDHISQNRPDILRVELVVKESHTAARALYTGVGFIAEGRFEKRFRMADGTYDADIPMVWMNKNFSS